MAPAPVCTLPLTSFGSVRQRITFCPQISTPRFTPMRKVYRGHFTFFAGGDVAGGAGGRPEVPPEA